jgi:hypothetical protein
MPKDLLYGQLLGVLDLRAAPDCVSRTPVKETWNVLGSIRSHGKASLILRTPGELQCWAAPSKSNKTTSTAWSRRESPGSPALQTTWLQLTSEASAATRGDAVTRPDPTKCSHRLARRKADDDNEYTSMKVASDAPQSLKDEVWSTSLYLKSFHFFTECALRYA